MRIVPIARRIVIVVSLAYWAIAILAAALTFYAHQIAVVAHGLTQTSAATDWRAAENVLVGFGGLYIALWIIALVTLWVRQTEHEPG